MYRGRCPRGETAGLEGTVIRVLHPRGAALSGPGGADVCRRLREPTGGLGVWGLGLRQVG